MTAASASGSRGNPISRESTFALPSGNTPIGSGRPAKPFTTALTVPSPPAATIASITGSTSRARRSTSPSEGPARRSTTVQPRRSNAATKRRRCRSADRTRPAAGFTMIRICRRTTRLCARQARPYAEPPPGASATRGGSASDGKMLCLVTGCAGFIGFHVTQYLLDRAERVIGIDNLNPYYDVALKEARLAQLRGRARFEFHQLDVADPAAMSGLVERHPDIDTIIHLAAQAGVRYSLTQPLAYVEANVKGQVVLLEAARKLAKLKSLVYASSSSVYGANTKQPFSVTD